MISSCCSPASSTSNLSQFFNENEEDSGWATDDEDESADGKPQEIYIDSAGKRWVFLARICGPADLADVCERHFMQFWDERSDRLRFSCPDAFQFKCPFRAVMVKQKSAVFTRFEHIHEFPGSNKEEYYIDGLTGSNNSERSLVSERLFHQNEQQNSATSSSSSATCSSRNSSLHSPMGEINDVVVVDEKFELSALEPKLRELAKQFSLEFRVEGNCPVFIGCHAGQFGKLIVLSDLGEHIQVSELRKCSFDAESKWTKEGGKEKFVREIIDKCEQFFDVVNVG